MSNLVQIHTCGDDLSKRWYISFYQIENGKRTRKRLYGQVNRIKNKRDRHLALRSFQFGIQDRLNKGLPIFEEELIVEKSPSKIQHNVAAVPKKAPFTIVDAIKRVLKSKENEIKISSYKNLKGRAEKFIYFLKAEKMHTKAAFDITRSDVVSFLDSVSHDEGISNRTRNNYLVDIRGLFNKMIELELVEKNPADHIKKINTTSEKNAVYTESQLDDIL